MSEGMTHDEARESLEALALDALDAGERDAVMAHVAGCDECQRELAALEHTSGELALAATPLAMSRAQRDRIRARLLARAAAERSALEEAEALAAAAPPLRVEPSVPGRTPDILPFRGAAGARVPLGGAWWLGLAAGVVAILGVGGYMRASVERDQLRDSIRTAAVERGAQAAALDSLRAALGERDRMIASLTGPDVHVMTLATTNRTPMGKMYWDQQRDAWTLVAHHIPMPKPGRTYQLWLVTPKQKISAGTFMPATNGDVMMHMTYALPHDSLAAVAVTDEPGGGSAQPTTAPLLIASK
jgi:anti-sigma-K factor RskA